MSDHYETTAPAAEILTDSTVVQILGYEVAGHGVPQLEDLSDRLAPWLESYEQTEWGDSVEQQFTTARQLLQETPFLIDAREGNLSALQTERWILCAGRESYVFPTILSKMLAQPDLAQDEGIRAVLQENLDDELGVQADGSIDPTAVHFMHYLSLLDKLGIDRSRFVDYDKDSGITLAIDTGLAVADKGGWTAIGYMLANEGMTPDTYGAAKSGFHHFADTTRQNAAERDFVDLHVEVDEHHVADLLGLIHDKTPDDTARAELLTGMKLALAGMHALVNEAHGAAAEGTAEV